MDPVLDCVLTAPTLFLKKITVVVVPDDKLPRPSKLARTRKGRLPPFGEEEIFFCCSSGATLGYR